MNLDDTLSDTIAAIYDAVDRPETWDKALGRVSDLMGSVGSHLMFWSADAQTAPFSTSNDRLDLQSSVEYVRDYAAIDPNRTRAERLPPGTIYSCIQHYDESLARRSAYHQEFLARYDMRYIAGCRVQATDDFSAYFCVARSHRQGPFVGADLTAIQRLLPHFQRAARMHQRFAFADLTAGSAANALDRVPYGVLVTNAAGKVLQHNSAAEDILGALDGLDLTHGYLGAAAARDSQHLLLNIHETVRTAQRIGQRGGGAMRIARPSGAPAYLVQFMPLSPQSRLGGLRLAPLALVMVTDPAKAPPKPAGRMLTDLFGLSPTEAQLALSLLDGRRLEEIADQRGVKITTLRSQLSSILAKTGTQRQSELLMMLARLPG